MSNAPLIVWASDRRGIITLYEGSGMPALTALSRSAVGLRLSEVFGNAEDVRSMLALALEDQPSMALVEAGGTTLEITSHPRRNAKGQIVGASGTAFDVSPRVRAESRLRAVSRHMEHIAQGAPVLLWSLDRAGNMTFAQGDGFAALGVKSAEIVGQSVYEQFADFPAGLQYCERALRGETLSNQLRGRGRVFDVQYYPDRDDGGEIIGMSGLAIDVTERVTADEEVRSTRVLLEQAQRLTQVGNWEWDIATNTIRGSAEFYRVFGVADGAAGSLAAFRSRIHPDDLDRVQEIAVRSAHEGAPYPVTLYRVLHPTEGTRIVEQRAELVRDGETGRVVRMIGTVQDVSERELAAQRLSTLTSALEQTGDAVFITNQEGIITYVNDAFVRQSQYPRQEAVGCTPRILKSGSHPSEFYSDVWNTILAGRTWRGSFLNRRKDGTFFHEEKTITPIRDHAGTTTHFVSTGRDVTERRSAEEAQARLQEAVSRSAHEWRATFDAVDSPIVILDGDGRVRRPNRAARDLANKGYQDIIGAPVAEVAPGLLWDAMAKAARQVAASGAVVSLQTIDHASEKTWDVGASPLTGPDIANGTVIVLARDVTAIMKLQESLRRAETMSAMGRLVAGVAHEVRNPLFGISATLDAFDLEFGDKPEYREYGQRLRHEMGRLTELMHDLLDYGKPAPAELGVGRLEPVVQRAVRACALMAQHAQVTIKVEVVDLPDVKLDSSRMLQVFLNLIENAIQHAPPGSEVDVLGFVSQDNQHVEVQVADAGGGFPEDDLRTIFEPFFTRRRGGTGLGLSIVQQIVTQHGGQILAENRPEGGALMRVRFPVVPPRGSL